MHAGEPLQPISTQSEPVKDQSEKFQLSEVCRCLVMWLQVKVSPESVSWRIIHCSSALLFRRRGFRAATPSLTLTWTKGACVTTPACVSAATPSPAGEFTPGTLSRSPSVRSVTATRTACCQCGREKVRRRRCDGFLWRQSEHERVTRSGSRIVTGFYFNFPSSRWLMSRSQTRLWQTSSLPFIIKALQTLWERAVTFTVKGGVWRSKTGEIIIEMIWNSWNYLFFYNVFNLDILLFFVVRGILCFLFLITIFAVCPP